MPRGFNIGVRVDGLENAQRIARRVRNLGEDPQPLLEIAGSVLEASTVQHFDEEKGPGGVPWPKSQRALRDGGRTLFEFGDLYDSVRSEVRANEVEIGFDDMNKAPGVVPALHYGSNRQTVVVAHERTVNEAFGVPLKPPVVARVRPHGRVTNLPPRPMLGVDDEDRRELEERWLEHLRGLFNAGP